MNKSPKTEAEWAAVAQRLQLDALNGALRTLETQVDALESESARQSAKLARLEEMVAQIHADAGADRPRVEGLASADSAAHDQPSARETRIDRRPVDQSSDLVLPEVGTNWESYLRNVERYIADRGIEVTGDPLSQLVPPHLAADIRRRFDAEFSPAPWDRWDVGSGRVGCARRRGDGLSPRRDARWELQGTASARKPTNGMDEGTIEKARSDEGLRRP